MAYPDDLLAQARFVAACDPRRPKQANLRRAVSTAYYAVFHLLVIASSNQIAPKKDVAGRVARAFSHHAMRKVCSEFANGFDGRTTHQTRSLVSGLLEPEIVDLASAFVELQESRNRADYDLTVDFTRIEVERLIASAADAIAKWRSVRAHQNAKVFLTALLVSEKWGRS